MRILFGLSAVTALAFASVALADPPGVTVKDGSFIAPDGKALYTFAKDTEANVSTCVDRCLAAWPVLAAAADAKAEGDWTIVNHPSGAKQWAYKGKPLYTFVRDKADGVATGASANWPVAKK